MTFELKGLDEMLANIAATIRYARGPEMKAAVYEPAGAQFEQALRANAPRARVSSAVPERDTAAIQDAVTKISGPATVPNVLVVVDAEKAPEANAVEYGTGERYTRLGAYRGSMPAHPFFRPTVRVERPRTVENISAGFLKEITDASKFAGSKSL